MDVVKNQRKITDKKRENKNHLDRTENCMDKNKTKRKNNNNNQNHTNL